jgi:magnesium-transporting ATPase (P-type)
MTGLSPQQAAHDRLLQYGRNEMTRPPNKSLWQLIREQFQDSLVQILLVVAILSAVFSVEVSVHSIKRHTLTSRTSI